MFASFAKELEGPQTLTASKLMLKWAGQVYAKDYNWLRQAFGDSQESPEYIFKHWTDKAIDTNLL